MLTQFADIQIFILFLRCKLNKSTVLFVKCKKTYMETYLNISYYSALIFCRNENVKFHPFLAFNLSCPLCLFSLLLFSLPPFPETVNSIANGLQSSRASRLAARAAFPSLEAACWGNNSSPQPHSAGSHLLVSSPRNHFLLSISSSMSVYDHPFLSLTLLFIIPLYFLTLPAVFLGNLPSLHSPLLSLQLAK